MKNFYTVGAARCQNYIRVLGKLSERALYGGHPTFIHCVCGNDTVSSDRSNAGGDTILDNARDFRYLTCHPPRTPGTGFADMKGAIAITRNL